MNQVDSTRETVGTRSRASASEGYAAVFATILIWSTPSLFQYYLNRYYDPWAQNFYRYLVACVSIAPLLIYRMRRGATPIDWRALTICIVPCLPNVVHQVTQVMALFYMGPGVYTIFTRASVIFTALLALAFFPEERHVIRQWQFQLGTGLGLIGAFGVVWFQPGWKSGHIALPGLFVAFTATFCWALYGILVKRPSRELGSIRSFGVISLITSALLLPLTIAFGKIGTPIHAGSCGDPRDRRGPCPITPTSLPSRRNGSFSVDLRRTPDSRSNLERGDPSHWRVPGHAHETRRHD